MKIFKAVEIQYWIGYNGNLQEGFGNVDKSHLGKDELDESYHGSGKE